MGVGLNDAGGQKTNSRKDVGRTLLWVALILGLLTRMALVLGLPVSQYSDMGWYLSRAQELLQTGSYSEGGIPTAYWPVGYPAFLAGVLAVGGPSAYAGQLANLFLSLLCLVLVYHWGLQRFRCSRVAGTAALLLAVYPNQMGYSVGLYSEPLFTALLLGMFLLVRPDASWRRMVAAGLLAGIATLVKAQMLLLGPLLLLVLALGGWHRRCWPPAIGRAALGALFMAVVVAPWTYRNLVVMGAPVAVSTNGGMSLLTANNPSMSTSLTRDFREDDDLVRSVRFSVADQVAADARAKAAAWGWIRDNPDAFIQLMPKKFFRLWAPDGESEWLFQAGYRGYDEQRVWFRTARIVNQVFYLTLLLACLWAFWRAPSSKGPFELALPLMIVFFSLLCMVFSGQSRYHAPLMPFIICYASWTLAFFTRGRQHD